MKTITELTEEKNLLEKKIDELIREFKNNNPGCKLEIEVERTEYEAGFCNIVMSYKTKVKVTI